CIDRGRRVRSGADYYYVRRAYAEQVRRAGGEPILLTLDTAPKRCADICNGFVITGGDDLPSVFSDAVASSGCEHLEDQERIAWDRALLDAVAARKQPLLGVCYGMQLINLHYGGSLCQEVLDEHASGRD